MPYALSTTKRKFHEILDSISNPPAIPPSANQNQHNASTSTFLGLQEPSAKRFKYARPRSGPISASLTRSIRSTSTTSTPGTSIASTMTQEKKPPNFAPWDHNQFLSRLETFRHVDKWISKPDPINEVQWAKRGWRCVGKERVGCVGGCGNEVLISLEPTREEEQPIEDLEPSEEAVEDYYDWREEAQKELVQRYTEMIVTEHDEGCLWRRRGCDDSIHRLPLAHQATTFQSLRKRYESLCALSADLPSTISQPPTLNTSKLIPHLFHILHPDQKSNPSTSHPASPSTTTNPTPTKAQTETTEPAPQPTICPRALTLALTGWQADPDSPTPAIATCTSCFRRLGLWLYNTPPTTSPSSPNITTTTTTTSASPPAPSSPTRTQPIINRLDPLTEHRTYCPWINTQSQSRNPVPAQEDLPGWEILRDMVLRIRPPVGLRVQGTPEGVDGVDGGVVDGSGDSGEKAGEERSKEERDKERWARLKKLKQVFRVRRRPKGAEGEKEKGK
ncbi:MAG: hypothetical protein Q9216_002945 [Gyalolechia sp. 2 TL-2023]